MCNQQFGGRSFANSVHNFALHGETERVLYDKATTTAHGRDSQARDQRPPYHQICWLYTIGRLETRRRTHPRPPGLVSRNTYRNNETMACETQQEIHVRITGEVGEKPRRSRGEVAEKSRRSRGEVAEKKNEQ